VATQEELIATCIGAGALKEGHFVLNSRRHARHYVAKDELGKRPWFDQFLAREMAGLVFKACNSTVTRLVAPAVGGVGLVKLVSLELRSLYGIEALALYAEENKVPFELDGNSFIKVNGDYVKVSPAMSLFYTDRSLVLKRGFDKDVVGQNVIVIDDILTTGDSVKRTVDAVKRSKGTIVAGVVLWNRGQVLAEEADVPLLFSAITHNLESFDPDDCPLCKAGVPVNTDYGHG
jgi:orotate phosphoribosyltransferase